MHGQLGNEGVRHMGIIHTPLAEEAKLLYMYLGQVVDLKPVGSAWAPQPP
jgi:hypothetical protein|eukprot:CAMPEP_0172690894 /NCGR_PEP_ID=MMETSP1074-20121228/24187_1 /TAXON_ID=2916 /ORGANISM="Ceratium fusus, Strain PA161109" /LENGTH=49 /DNA_ID=CAMNT_0013510897 /DNA_START=168 /DNA_END=317 /DNA_ORIENTATION=-